MRTTQQFLSGLAAALATAGAVHGQQTWYVDDDAPAGGAGLSWNSAFSDLQDALLAAATTRTPDTIIKIAQGVYTPDRGMGDRRSSFVVSSGVTLMGGFAGRSAADADARAPAAYVSVLSGDLARNDTPGFGARSDNCYHVLTGATASVADVQGVWICGGHADGPSAISADLGAACWGGDGLRLSECIISDNFAASGGSVYWSLWEAVTLHRCRVVGNRVGGDNAGGAAIIGWSVNVLACVLAENTSPGAVVLARSESLMDSNLIAGNRSTAGSLVLDVYSGSHRLNCNTIVGNRAHRAMIGFSLGGMVLVGNTIFLGNTSDLLGDRLIDDSPSAAEVGFAACIIRNPANALASGVGVAVSARDIFDTDPLFADAAGRDTDPATVLDNDYRLRAGSPAIDAGFGSAFALDPAGNTRPRDDPGTPDMFPADMPTTLDIGAYEFQGVSCRADWNGSGQVRADDVPGFVDSWFGRDPRADFNRLDGPTLQDLFDFLTAFFTGCP